MPVFELSLDDGRKLHIDADDQDAALNGYKHFQDQEASNAPPAPLTINPTDVRTARLSGYTDAEIVDHLSSKNPAQLKEARAAGYSDADILQHLFGEHPQGSGVVAAIQRAIPELIRSNQETAHQFYGASAPKPSDPNYVPANLTDGWNWSQIPQKLVEMAPGFAQDIAAGTVAAKGAKGVGLSAKMAALAGAAGAGLSMWNRTAGDTTHEAAQARTGDANAEPNADDRTRGGLTAAASAAIGAMTPARLIPGANKVSTVGAQGALDAIKKYLATTSIGAGSSGAADAVTQIGTTIGTDKGVQYDPARGIEAAAGGGLAGVTLASPKVAADLIRSASLREHGGANKAATANYATRLQTAGDGNLGNSKADFNAHDTVKADLKNELSDAAKNVRRDVKLSPEADNALQRAQTGGTVTPSELAIIERETAGAPDGANASYLARTLHVANMAEGRGSFDSNGSKWAGGLSGAVDKNLPAFVKPTNLALGSAASAVGLHLFGAASPMLAAGGIGGYGAARAIDAMTGMRSPAKTFAEHFADRNAQLRLSASPQMALQSLGGPASPWGPRPPLSGPTGPQVAPPTQLPTAPTPGPWGPRPQATTAVPQVPQSAPAAPPVQPPQINPMALKMLNARLKAGLPPEPNAATEAPPAKPDISPLALKMLASKLKAGLPAEPQDAPAPVEAQSPQGIPKGIAAQTKALMSGLSKVAKMKAAAEAPAPQEKITKSNGKVNTDDMFTDVGGYEPIPADRMQKTGMSHEQMAQLETDSYVGHRPQLAKAKYFESVMDTLAGRRDAVEATQAKHPEYSHALQGLLKQLYEVGSSRKRALQAINHYAGLMSPEAGKALKDNFKPQLDRLWQK